MKVESEIERRLGVRILETTPGRDCTLALVLTQSVAMALIPHTDKPITFRIATAAVDCTGYRVAVNVD